jgi:hypothetical protein
MRTKQILLFLLIGVILASCSSEFKADNACIEKIELSLTSNGISIIGDTFQLDYTNSIDSGFVFPSTKQSDNGLMKIKIHVSELNKNKKYYYKVYYQNESYKFDEKNESDALVAENFYGSWENPAIGFIEVNKNIVNDGKGVISTELRLVGNPRNEDIYYNVRGFTLYEDSIAKQIKIIQATPSWMEDVNRKAKENNRKVEDQMRLDALWMLESLYRKEKNTKKHNLRWRRNLRIGNYSVMAVLVEEDGLETIPATIQNVCVNENYTYKNPFKYFLAEQKNFPINSDNNSKAPVVKIDKAFTLKAKVDFTKGVYIDDTAYPPNYDMSGFKKTCAKNQPLYKNAQLEQFFHAVNKDETLNNIPVIADVVGNYPRKLYEKNAKKYNDASRIKIPIGITDCPCKSLDVDTVNNLIRIINPAATKNNLRKENVGITTRDAFTYGKYTVKIKMAEQMNKENVWNGLTNAIWMIYRGGDDYNARRVCENNGYIPKYSPANNQSKRYKQQAYSEIDFEIVKCAQYWPKTSYKYLAKYKKEEEANAPNVMVTCTNWDLACDDVADFVVGAVAHKMGENVYELHRWDTWNQALTLKTPANEDELFASPYYYFQIDWTPKEIIWRIGPEKNKLREVGRMNDVVTQIPNNQMVLVITQEYHLARWWPEAPFSQDDVPFPSKNHVGTVYSIEIE